MLSRIRGRLTYSNVVASMALFIALGGVSYAAVKLPKNSVGGTQIKKNAVTGSKVRNSSLTGLDVKNSSLRGGDVKNSSLTGSDVKNSSLTGSDVRDGSLTAKDFSGSVQGAQGSAGAQGVQGPQGAKGDVGPAGPTASAFVESAVDVTLSLTPKTVLQATITTTVSSRIIAHASVDVLASVVPASLYCFINDNPALGGASDWSIRTSDDLVTGIIRLNSGIVGAKVLPAGTYTVRVGCGKNSGTMDFDEGNLSLIAVAD